jgi:hypothetical protein
MHASSVIFSVQRSSILLSFPWGCLPGIKIFATRTVSLCFLIQSLITECPLIAFEVCSHLNAHRIACYWSRSEVEICSNLTTCASHCMLLDPGPKLRQSRGRSCRGCPTFLCSTLTQAARYDAISFQNPMRFPVLWCFLAATHAIDVCTDMVPF